MVWFHKQKRRITPELCANCHERLGVVHLGRVDPHVEGPDSVSLCDECARALRNDPESS